MFKLSSKITFITTKIAIAGLAVCSTLAQAQEEVAETIQKKTALDTFVLDGGPTMIFIGLAFIAMLFFIVFTCLWDQLRCARLVLRGVFQHLLCCSLLMQNMQEPNIRWLISGNRR